MVKFLLGKYHVVEYVRPYVPKSLPPFGKYTPATGFVLVAYTPDETGTNTLEDFLSVHESTLVPDRENDDVSDESNQRVRPATPVGVT